MPLEQKLDPVNPFARADPWGSLQKPPLRLTPSPALAAAVPPTRNPRASSRPSQNILTGSALPPPMPPAANGVAPAADGATAPFRLEAPGPQPKLRASEPVSDARNLRGLRGRRLILFSTILAGFGLLSLAVVAFGIMVATRPVAPPAVISRAAILTVSRPPEPAADAHEPRVLVDQAQGAAVAPTPKAPVARPSTAARRIRLVRLTPAPAAQEAPPEALLVPTPSEPLAPAPDIAAEPPPRRQPERLSDPEAPMAKRRGDNP